MVSYEVNVQRVDRDNEVAPPEGTEVQREEGTWWPRAPWTSEWPEEGKGGAREGPNQKTPFLGCRSVICGKWKVAEALGTGCKIAFQLHLTPV